MKLFNRISSTTLDVPFYTRYQEEGISRGNFSVTDRNDSLATAVCWGHTSPPAVGPLSPKNRRKTLITPPNDTGGWAGDFPYSDVNAAFVTINIADGLGRNQWRPLITREYDLYEKEKYKERGMGRSWIDQDRGDFRKSVTPTGSADSGFLTSGLCTSKIRVRRII